MSDNTPAESQRLLEGNLTFQLGIDLTVFSAAMETAK